MTRAPAPRPVAAPAMAAIVSPCTKVCVIDRASRLCHGCLRSIDEIGAWSSMTPAARDAVMADLPGRRDLIAPPRD